MKEEYSALWLLDASCILQPPGKNDEVKEAQLPTNGFPLPLPSPLLLLLPIVRADVRTPSSAVATALAKPFAAAEAAEA